MEVGKKDGNSDCFFIEMKKIQPPVNTLGTVQGTNISPQKGACESMIFLSRRWDMLVFWCVGEIDIDMLIVEA